MSSAGTARFGAGATTTGGQSVTAGTIQVNGTFRTTASGAGLVWTGNVLLQINAVVRTNATNGNIKIAGPVDASAAGVQSLTLMAGTGTIDLLGAIGGSRAVSSLAVASSGNLTVSGTLRTTGSATLTGTGTTTLNGATVGGGLSVKANAIVLSANTVTAGGAISLAARNAVALNASVRAGGTIAVLANQDGAGTEGFTQASLASLVTTNDTPAAMTVTVNIAGGGIGNAAIAAGTAGTTPGTSGGRITIQANAGRILDGDGGATNNLTAGTVVLSAGAGVGTAADPIETKADRVEASGGSGAAFVANSGL